MKAEKLLKKSKLTKPVAGIIVCIAAVFPLPVCYSAESVPFTETPLYKYICEIAQQKSPTCRRQLQVRERQEPKRQPQEQPEQETDTVRVDRPYKPTAEITLRPIHQPSGSLLSALTHETAFDEAIDILRHSVKPPLNIFVLWRDLEDNANIDRDTPIGMEGLSGITLKKHLELILASVSTVGDREIGYVIEDGIIRIATKDSLPKVMRTRVYDITDLTARPARFYESGGPYMFPGNTYGYGRDYGPGRDYQYGRYPSRYSEPYGYNSRLNTYRGYSSRLGQTYRSGIGFY